MIFHWTSPRQIPSHFHGHSILQPFKHNAVSHPRKPPFPLQAILSVSHGSLKLCSRPRLSYRQALLPGIMPHHNCGNCPRWFTYEIGEKSSEKSADILQLGPTRNLLLGSYYSQQQHQFVVDSRNLLSNLFIGTYKFLSCRKDKNRPNKLGKVVMTVSTYSVTKTSPATLLAEEPNMSAMTTSALFCFRNLYKFTSNHTRTHFY